MNEGNQINWMDVLTVLLTACPKGFRLEWRPGRPDEGDFVLYDRQGEPQFFNHIFILKERLARLEAEARKKISSPPPEDE